MTAPVARLVLPLGIKPVDEQRLREILSGYADFIEATLFEIQSLAYEVRNSRIIYPTLLALVQRYASECVCAGTGKITRGQAFVFPGEKSKYVTVDCPDCADIRAALAAAQGVIADGAKSGGAGE